jgi:hypothetical protein
VAPHKERVKSQPRETICGPGIIMETVADPAAPRSTIRRARRSDPLDALLRAGTITPEHYDAAEMLREDIEESGPSSPGSGSGMSQPQPWGRLPVSDRQLRAWQAVRRAAAAVDPADRQPVGWVLAGGTVESCAAYLGCHHQVVAASVRSGLDALAQYYFGPGRRTRMVLAQWSEAS